MTPCRSHRTAWGASIQMFDISSVTGYDMLRTVPSANIMCLSCSVVAGDFQRVIVTL
jgi:hypothetical protein